MLRKVCADEIPVAVNSCFISVEIFEVSASNRPPTNVELTSDDPTEAITSMIRETEKSTCS